MVALKQKFFRNEVVDGQVVSSYFMELFGESREEKKSTHGGNLVANGSKMTICVVDENGVFQNKWETYRYMNDWKKTAEWDV